MNDQIKNSLDKMAEDLDQQTVRQLDQIRTEAITASNKTWIEKLSWPVLGPALAAMVLVVVFFMSGNKQLIQAEPVFDDLDILANHTDAELLEDLEFIAWLEQENVLEGELL